MNRFDYEQWGAKATAARGDRLPQSKLDVEKVREIRTNRQGLTMKQQAEMYGVHCRTIQKVHYRQTWIHA